MSTLYFKVCMYSVKESLPVSGLWVALYTDFASACSRGVLYTHIFIYTNTNMSTYVHSFTGSRSEGRLRDAASRKCANLGLVILARLVVIYPSGFLHYVSLSLAVCPPPRLPFKQCVRTETILCNACEPHYRHWPLPSSPRSS